VQLFFVDEMDFGGWKPAADERRSQLEQREMDGEEGKTAGKDPALQICENGGLIRQRGVCKCRSAAITNHQHAF